MDKSGVSLPPSHHITSPSPCVPTVYPPSGEASAPLFLPDSNSISDGNLGELEGTSVFSGGRHHDYGSREQPR